MSDISEGYHDAFGYDDDDDYEGRTSYSYGAIDWTEDDYKLDEECEILALLYPKFKAWALAKLLKELDQSANVDPDKYYNIFYDCLEAYAIAKWYDSQKIEKAINYGINNKLDVKSLCYDSVLNMLKYLDKKCEDNEDDLFEQPIFNNDDEIPF